MCSFILQARVHSSLQMVTISCNFTLHSFDFGFPLKTLPHTLIFSRFLQLFYKGICFDMTLFGRFFGNLFLKTFSDQQLMTLSSKRSNVTHNLQDVDSFRDEQSLMYCYGTLQTAKMVLLSFSARVAKLQEFP